MKKVLLSLSIVTLLMSCNNTTEEIITTAPATYNFARNGSSSVSFDGQTTRIKMGDEFAKSLTKSSIETVASLNGKFDHNAGEINFENADLNMSSKNIRSKVASSIDLFSSNSTDATAIKADFDFWISAQVNEVFPKWNDLASAGNAGQIQEAGGGSMRYVNAKGLEYNQAIVKGLIGGLMVDQILNNYLSPLVLDEASNISDNDGNVLESGKNYTAMEHKWDEAFGYLYGNEVDAAAPALNMDNFLNKYLARVEADTDFVGISQEIYNAFKLGRAAIVAKDYITRNAQAEILREKISEIVGIRAVYYLQQGKNNLSIDMGGAFHDLSEGFGFIYSLQFTRKPNSSAPYFSKSEVDGFISTLMFGNGFWDVSTTTLDEISNKIAAKFNFTVAQAGN